MVDPERAIIRVQSYLPATNMLAQTTLRAVLGQHELDEMLSERKKLSTDVQSILDTQTETWGIKISNVEIRTVELTENMVRAIAKQAEAERDRRAKARLASPTDRGGNPARVPLYATDQGRHLSSFSGSASFSRVQPECFSGGFTKMRFTGRLTELML